MSKIPSLGKLATYEEKLKSPTGSYVEQNEKLFEACLLNTSDGIKTAAETKHQKKVIELLEKHDFEVIKVVIANKSGISDLVACSPAGQFWKIEVKHEAYEPSALQLVKLRKFWKNNAVALIAYGIEDFKSKFKTLMT